MMGHAKKLLMLGWALLALIVGCEVQDYGFVADYYFYCQVQVGNSHGSPAQVLICAPELDVHIPGCIEQPTPGEQQTWHCPDCRESGYTCLNDPGELDWLENNPAWSPEGYGTAADAYRNHWRERNGYADYGLGCD